MLGAGGVDRAAGPLRRLRSARGSPTVPARGRRSGDAAGWCDRHLRPERQQRGQARESRRRPPLAGSQGGNSRSRSMTAVASRRRKAIVTARTISEKKAMPLIGELASGGSLALAPIAGVCGGLGSAEVPPSQGRTAGGVGDRSRPGPNTARHRPWCAWQQRRGSRVRPGPREECEVVPGRQAVTSLQTLTPRSWG